MNHSTGLCTLKWRYIALRTVEPWHEPLELQTVDELALSPNPSSSQPRFYWVGFFLFLEPTKHERFCSSVASGGWQLGFRSTSL